MSRVMLTTSVRHAFFGLALAGLAMSSTTRAQAGDLGGPAYGPSTYGAPFEPNGLCRILHERRVDPYGRETIHRIRMCDEGPVYPSPDWTAAPPEGGYGRRPYYQPSPSQYYGYPRPPAPIHPTY